MTMIAGKGARGGVRRRLGTARKAAIALPVALAVLLACLPATASGARAGAAVAAVAPADASADTSVVLRMKLGEPGYASGPAPADGAGAAYACPPPLEIGGALLLPLRAVAEAFGAQVDYIDPSPEGGSIAASAGAGEAAPYPRVECLFMGNASSLAVDDGTVGTAALASSLNGEPLPQGMHARLVGDTAYLPAPAFDLCMGTSTDYGQAAGDISITLADDGSIRDLSGLFGEILESRVGNSYFKWSIDVPRKSMLAETSFNGSEAMVFCMSKYVTIQVSVSPAEGMTLEALREEAFAGFDYPSLSGMPGPSSPSSPSSPSGQPGQPSQPGQPGQGARFIEQVEASYFTASLTRVYVRSGYVYIVEVTVYPMESEGRYVADETLFDEGGEFRALADTFALGPFDGSAPVFDISKVQGDFMEYVCYVDVPESDRRIRCWSVSAMPSWFELSTPTDDECVAVLGQSGGERFSAKAYMPDAGEGAGGPQGAISGFAREAEQMFNPAVFTMDGERQFDFDGRPASEIAYTLREGGAAYSYVERRILAGGIVYELSLRTTERRFRAREQEYMGVLDSFKVGVAGQEALQSYLARQAAAARRLRVSPGDAAAAVGGDGWKSSLPGYWAKARNVRDTPLGGVLYRSDAVYLNPAAGAVVGVTEAPLYVVAGLFDGETDLSEMAAPILEQILAYAPYGGSLGWSAPRGAAAAQAGVGEIETGEAESSIDAGPAGRHTKRVITAACVGERAADGMRYMAAIRFVCFEAAGADAASSGSVGASAGAGKPSGASVGASAGAGNAYGAGEPLEGGCYVVFTLLPESRASPKNLSEIDAFLEAFAPEDAGMPQDGMETTPDAEPPGPDDIPTGLGLVPVG